VDQSLLKLILVLVVNFKKDANLTVHSRLLVNVVNPAHAFEVPSIVVIQWIAMDQDKTVAKNVLNVPRM
jgi:hypothetical protein